MRPPPLWLSLRFPQLPLERLGEVDAALVLVAPGRYGRINPRGRLLAVNAPAAAAGIRIGMRVTSARALLPDVLVSAHDPHAQQKTLNRLAAWALRYSDTVCIDPPTALLVDVAGSLTLFGGVDALAACVDRDAATLAYTTLHAFAPTPLAASVFTAAGRPARVRDRALLALALAGVPADALGLAPTERTTLIRLGIDDLGALLMLPRAGLRRRLGSALADRLARLLGELPDPRTRYRPPETFDATLRLPAPVDDSEALLFAIRRLLRDLGGVLAARDQAVTRLDLELCGSDAPVRTLAVPLARPGRDAEHWIELIRARLSRVALNAPVDAVRLRVAQHCDAPARSAELFDALPDHERAFAQLLERLQARLGDAAVKTPLPVADHRPEQAWTLAAPGSSAETVPLPGWRPLWLRPQPLMLPGGPPPLWRLHGPERLEAGWWDGGEIARDYYRATTDDGRELWLYRECRDARRWFIHGHAG